LHFRAGQRATLLSLGYEIPGGILKPVIDKQHKRFSLSICLLALIKDARGEVAKKVSQEVPFSGALTGLESFARDAIIETQPFILAPGRYTIESAVVSLGDNRASTMRTSLFVPGPAPLGVSDLVLVNSLEQQPRKEDARQFDPLVSSLGKIRPELDPRLVAGSRAQIPIYFQVYANPAAPQPQVDVVITRDGTAPRTLSPNLLPAVAAGEQPYYAALDIGQLTPGNYVLRVTARQAGTSAEESLALEVAN
ncbi:MAG TPA: hypothetical protein VMU80_18100, partial [Bryobacteraceae bacterium]|nr:hypothetical protein [Bryobacteraceae bacterium]